MSLDALRHFARPRPPREHRDVAHYSRRGLPTWEQVLEELLAKEKIGP